MLASSRSSLTALAVLAAVAMASSLAHAQSSQSLLSSVAIGSVVAMSVTASEAVTAVSGEGGSLTTLSELPAASINFAVESVRFVGDTAILLLRYAPQGAEFAVQLSGKVVEDAGLAAGQSVRALAALLRPGRWPWVPGGQRPWLPSGRHWCSPSVRLTRGGGSHQSNRQGYFFLG